VSPETVSESLATLATFWYIGDAAVAQNALDAAGIDSWLDDSEIVRVSWFNANAVGGVKLRVEREDVIRAAEILETKCEPLPDAEVVGEEPEAVVSVCAACGSSDIRPQPRALFFLLIAAVGIALGVAGRASEAAFFGIVAAGLILLMSARWRCSNCGETWN
jgi:hypothetical protein